MPTDLKTMIAKTLQINKNYILQFEHLLDISSSKKFIKNLPLNLNGENIYLDFLKEYQMPVMIVFLQ